MESCSNQWLSDSIGHGEGGTCSTPLLQMARVVVLGSWSRRLETSYCRSWFWSWSCRLSPWSCSWSWNKVLTQDPIQKPRTVYFFSRLFILCTGLTKNRFSYRMMTKKMNTKKTVANNTVVGAVSVRRLVIDYISFHLNCLLPVEIAQVETCGRQLD